MNCIFCRLFFQFIVNVLNLLDHTLNTILLGDSDETVSARTARARNAGSKAAAVFCNFLTWAQKVVTFGRFTMDHCDYSLDKNLKPNSREIWDWNSNRILTTPISEVAVIEDPGNN